jgi:hypothetical protein
MKQITGAILKSNDGVCDFTLHLPSGAPYIIRFISKDGGDAIAKVPKVLTYTDDFGKVKTVMENLPQYLLDKYKHIDLVETIEEEEIKKDVIVGKTKPAKETVAEVKEKPKEKKNEKSSV